VNSLTLDEELADAVGTFIHDPLGFVQWAYPWPINGERGPDPIQSRFLERLGEKVRAHQFNGETPVAPVRMGLSSGHGIGKSALGAWLVDWIMSTRPDCHGTITANTNDQLEFKTWAAIREWTKKCITARWFEINSQIMYRIGSRESWFCMPASCDAHNSEAFAGQHAKGSTSFYINDEDSNVPDSIHKVEEGGLTDGEPMIFLFGNPTRNTGEFHRVAFGDGRDRWDIQIVDSRESHFANKALIQEWMEDYGEDSDFFRVRVRGLPPNADELQYIDAARVVQAQRNVSQPIFGEPLVAGVDVSGGGKAWSVCRFRRGFDARSIPPIRLTGEQTVANDRQMIISRLAEALMLHKPDAMFIDAAFGAVVVSRLRQMGYTQVHEVNFGGPSSDVHDANMRAFMWRSMKEWLPRGALDPKDQRLASDLCAPGFHLNQSNKLVLESKESMQKRNVASPDDGDALALTFAIPVRAKVETRPPSRPTIRPSGQAWMS
jgi:hypothetical protein